MPEQQRMRGSFPSLKPARCLDSVQLQRLELAFRDWAESPQRPGLGLSRRRILMIYLLIRYTGARLNEVLKLYPRRDIDSTAHAVFFRKTERHGTPCGRDVQIPEVLSSEIQ